MPRSIPRSETVLCNLNAAKRLVEPLKKSIARAAWLMLNIKRLSFLKNSRSFFAVMKKFISLKVDSVTNLSLIIGSLLAEKKNSVAAALAQRKLARRDHAAKTGKSQRA